MASEKVKKESDGKKVVDEELFPTLGNKSNIRKFYERAMDKLRPSSKDSRSRASKDSHSHSRGDSE